MKIIKVSKRIYADTGALSGVKTEYGMVWSPTRPELIRPGSPKERLYHWLGYHVSYGQPFCVMCGLAER